MLTLFTIRSCLLLIEITQNVIPHTDRRNHPLVVREYRVKSDLGVEVDDAFESAKQTAVYLDNAALQRQSSEARTFNYRTTKVQPTD